MGNNTGVILELKGKKAILMTSTCDFITISRRPEMFVGQQLDLSNYLLPRKTNPMRYFAIAGIFVLIFCSVLFYQFLKPSSVFAYVDIDINPSLELSIDKKANVIKVKALNSDAEGLIKNISLENKSLTSAVRIIIEESHSKGFIQPDTKNAVLISASIKSGNEKVLDGIVSELQKTDFKAGTKSIKAEVIKVEATKRTEAVKNNISMGRYKLYEEISESEGNIDMQKAKTEGISKIIEAYESKKQNNNYHTKQKPVQAIERVPDIPQKSTDNNTPAKHNSKKPENNNSQNHNNVYTKDSISSAKKPDKAEKPIKVFPSFGEDNSLKKSDDSESEKTTKESPNKNENFNQGSKTIPSEYSENAHNTDNNGNTKNNPSNEKKEENRDNNHTEKGKSKK